MMGHGVHNDLPYCLKQKSSDEFLYSGTSADDNHGNNFILSLHVYGQLDNLALSIM